MRIVMACTDVDFIDRRIFHEAKSLTEAGHQVILFGGPDLDRPAREIVEGMEIRRHWHPLPLWRRPLKAMAGTLRRASWIPGNLLLLSLIKAPMFLASELRSALRRMAGKKNFPVNVESLDPWEVSLANEAAALNPDCVVAHDLPMLRSLVVAAKRNGAKIVYDSHECYPDLIFFEPELQDYYRKLEARWIKEANLVYTVNPLLAEHMSNRYQRVVESITNAIDPPAGFDPRKKYDHFRKYLGLPSDVRILLYQGGFAPNRGLENLVESMGFVQPSVHLVMLGYNDFKDVLIRHARSHGLSRRVHIVPPRTQADLLEWTASADAGIIPYHIVDPNIWYVSPNKLFEYIAAELPFLSNDLPFVKMVVEATKGGSFADLTNPKSCGEAINRMFADPARLVAMRENLRACRAQYLWQVQGEKLLGLFESIGVPCGRRKAAA